MSKGRVFSRPRTKVYDSNYNLGESYYKSALDNLDRKYGTTRIGDISNGDLYGLRSPPPPPPTIVPEIPLPRTGLREMEEEIFGEGLRRRPNSALIGEYESIFDNRMRDGVANERPLSARTLEQEFEDDITSSMQRIRARATRSAAEEMEDMESSMMKKDRLRSKFDFGEKMIESVGLSSKSMQQALEDGGSTLGRRRCLRMVSSADVGEGDEFAKWTALRPSGMPRRNLVQEEEEDQSFAQAAAAARARKTRARLEDLESEMQAISDKSAAREKRVRDLRALVQENEASALDNLQSTIRMKTSIQSEKKMVNF